MDTNNTLLKIKKRLEITIKYFNKPYNQFQNGRLFEARSLLQFIEKQMINKQTEKMRNGAIYKYSKDFNLLYDLIVSKKQRIFCRIKTEDDMYEYSSIYKREDGTIFCGVRGITYFEIHDWHIERCSDCQTEKDVLEKYCQKYKLEFLSPCK